MLLLSSIDQQPSVWQRIYLYSLVYLFKNNIITEQTIHKRIFYSNNQIRDIHYIALNPDSLIKAVEQIEEKEKINLILQINTSPIVINILFGQYKFLQENTVQAVKYLFEQKNIPVDHYINVQGQTALMLAARTDNLLLLQMLLNKNADLKLRDKLNHDVLIHAVFGNSMEVFDYIFTQHRNDLEFNSDMLITLLQIILERDSVTFLESLLDYHPKISHLDKNGRNALHFVAEISSYKCLHLLLNSKQFDTNFKDNNGNTPLMAAAESGNWYVAKQFLEHGAKLNEVNNEGNNVLQTAIFFRNHEIAGTILKEYRDQVDLQHKDKDGYNLLLACTNLYDEKIFDMLLDLDIDIEALDNISNNILLLAASNNQIDLVTRLLKMEIFDVNHKNQNGITALHFAILQENLEMVKMLVEYGADVELEDTGKSNAIAYAISKRNIDIMRYLLDCKPEMLNKKYSYGSILHIAILLGFQDIVDFLLQYNIDISITDDSKKTALDFAKQKQDNVIINLIQEHMQKKNLN